MSFASPQHEPAASAATDFFSEATIVDGVLLVGSWARGYADPASDLDIAVLVRPGAADADRLIDAWERSGEPIREAAALLGRLLNEYVELPG